MCMIDDRSKIINIGENSYFFSVLRAGHGKAIMFAKAVKLLSTKSTTF